MARQARIKIAGIPWHVVHRGHNHDACFFDPKDYAFYLNQLTRLASEHRCAVHAYALMTNHVHLLVTPNDCEGVSRMMKVLAQLAATRTNRERKRSGALWEGRFRSSLVETSTYLLRCYRYIELNPVRAGLVDHPRDYPWSSYRANAEGAPSPLVRPHDEFLALGAGHDERREAYRDLFGEPLEPGEILYLRNRSRGGFVIGGPGFEQRVASLSGLATAPARASRTPAPKVPVP